MLLVGFFFFFFDLRPPVQESSRFSIAFWPKHDIISIRNGMELTSMSDVHPQLGIEVKMLASCIIQSHILHVEIFALRVNYVVLDGLVWKKFEPLITCVPILFTSEHFASCIFIHYMVSTFFFSFALLYYFGVSSPGYLEWIW